MLLIAKQVFAILLATYIVNKYKFMINSDMIVVMKYDDDDDDDNDSNDNDNDDDDVILISSQITYQ